MAKRRTMKRRMTKRRRNVKKMIRKSRKMRGGGLFDFNLFGRKNPQQQNYNMMNESNSDFRNQPRIGQQQNYNMTNESNSSFRDSPRIGQQSIQEFPDREYAENTNIPTKFAYDTPVDKVKIDKKSSWW
jgi:hypothetical protein